MTLPEPSPTASSIADASTAATGGRAVSRERSAVRRLLGEIAVPFLLLCALDAGIRWYVASHRDAPLPKLLPSPVASGKYLSYRQLADTDRPLDLVIMGQSQMLRASMRIIRETVERETGREMLGFNFSAPLQSIEFDRRLLEDVLVPIKPPRVVVLGLLPANLLYEQSPRDVERITHALPVFALHRDTATARLQDLLFRSSALLTYREVLHDAVMREPPQVPFWVTLGRTADPFGDVPIAVPVHPVLALTPWERAYIDQFADFEDLLTRSTLFKHLHRLARTCRAHGIQLVLLINAVHPIALQEFPHGADDLARFSALVHETAAAEKLPVLDAAPGGVGPPGMFADAAHTNVDGTRWMSEQIAHFLIQQGLLDTASAHSRSPSGP